MDAFRWQRVNELFEAAIARPVDERPAFLAGVCAGDEELAHQLQRLVRAHERTTGLLETPVGTEILRILASPDHAAPEAPLSALRVGEAFIGNERFEVRRRLGAGGMGVVYEVFDRTRHEIVALKTLRRARAADIYRLKREFRSLADVAHPNLVSLYELVVEDADCFFTMERVHGVNLVDYVRESAAMPAPIHYDRVRHVFRQVIAGIACLHGRAKLHRDIKPSNMLVTAEPRVVILDFGLTSDVDSGDASIGESMAGTPAYLAPERRAGLPPSASDDWYGVGVTFYEALAGRPPFDGPIDEMRRQKREVDPVPLAAIVSEIPDDLNALCMGLLRRDPVRRLTGGEAARLLEPNLLATDDAPEIEIEPRFIGRTHQIDVLENALRTARCGTATTVYVHGPSGIGKSCLVEHFLDGVLARDDIVVLRGRCYEREAVPYKALDGVIDSVSQHLRGLPPRQMKAVLPPTVTALFRLFPVMQQVGAGLIVRSADHEAVDPLALRQRAFDALRDLLGRLAARRPVIVYIDDLHWGDADSATLLEALLRPPEAPPILTIACLRAEEVASKPFLQRLLAGADAQSCISLSLGPMSNDEARELLMSAIGEDTTLTEAAIVGLAGEAAGNPFLLRHVAGYLATRPARHEGATWAQMLDERLHSLPPGAQRFLETLAICGTAMAPDVVHEAAGLAGNERQLVARLRASHLLRASGSAHRVEPYHDRIRETVGARVSGEDRRSLHRSIARALLARGEDDPESLYEHYREAGNREDAAAQAALAATKADAALAFDRAAAYYRAALELAAVADARPGWKERLAAALANAGRPAEAADAYLDAARDADPARQVELERVAAEQLLIGGHIDRGLDVTTRVLAAVRLRLARGPRATLAALLYRRAQLRWRGLNFVERDAENLSSAELLRIDTCWSVITGLGTVDYLHAAHFQARHLLLALETGEPRRIARALAFDIMYFSIGGGRSRRATLEAAARAQEMAARVGDPQAIALCALMRGGSAFLVGDWATAYADSTRALGMMRDRYIPTTWERNSAHAFRLYALMMQGKLRDVSGELPGLLTAAKARGNLYFETELRTRANLIWLAADKPDEGIEAATAVMRQWSHAGFHRQHFTYMLDRVQTELYRGCARAAWEVIASDRKALERSQMLRVQYFRIEAAYMRARCALLMAATGENRPRFLAIARGDARTIARENMQWSNPLAALLLATIAHLEGDARGARDRLVAAVTGFERADMNVYLAVARRRLSELSGDDAAQELRRQADDWMAAQGIVNPARITRLMAPGFPDDRDAD